MYSVRSIDVMSCAKMTGIIYGCLGLIVVPFILVVGLGSLLRGGSNSFSGLAMSLLAILAPIFYGFMGFLMGGLTAWAYNFAARYIGGIRLELRSEGANPSSNLGLI
jgi:hypothetical protein